MLTRESEIDGNESEVDISEAKCSSIVAFAILEVPSLESSKASLNEY